MSAPAVSSKHRDGSIRVAREAHGTLAICIEGDFDMANAPALEDQIDLALETGNNLILDLSDATFVDSSVINVLMRAVNAVRGREQTLVLQLGTAAIVERALELSRIEQVLPRAHDRKEALWMVQSDSAQSV